MNFAICDDHTEVSKLLYEKIKFYFAKYDLKTLDHITLYQDGNALWKDYENGIRFDLLFLDIVMPTISGMEIARRIRLIDPEILIVFITAYPDYMPASFKVEAFDFILKPITDRQLESVLYRCIRKFQQKHGHLIVKTSLGMAHLFVDHIVYINSNLHYLDFILKDGSSVRSKMRIQQMEEALQFYPQFIRCHQSYLVNLNYVTEVQRLQLYLSVRKIASLPKTIPISRKYTASVKEKFLLYHLKFGRNCT